VLAQSFTGAIRGQLLFEEVTYNVDHAPVAAVNGQTGNKV
jgi:hypothetical protein